MKKIKIIFSLSFFILLTATTLLTVFIPDKKHSEAENRELAQKPVVSIETITNGAFQQGITDYLSDQFPLRETMIKLNTLSNRLLGSKNLNGAYLGEANFYFEVIENDNIDFERNTANLNAIKYFEKKYPTIDVKTILAPTSSVIYNYYLPKGASLYDSDLLYNEAIQVLGDNNFIDIRDEMISEKDSYLYYKTDHHWTSLGAYIAYTEYCNSINSTPKSYDDFEFEQVTDSFYGSLHSKNLDIFAKPDTISIAKKLNITSVTVKGNEIDIYDYDKLSSKDKYLIFFGDNYGETVITTDNKNGKTLLIIKDSFANSLVPLLANEFENVIMIDQRYFNEKKFSPLIEKYNVTNTLFMYEVTNLSIQDKLASACKN